MVVPSYYGNGAQQQNGQQGGQSQMQNNTSEAPRSGSAYNGNNLDRFQYSGNYFGFTFSGSFDADNQQMSGSLGAPQSDMRYQTGIEGQGSQRGAPAAQQQYNNQYRPQHQPYSKPQTQSQHQHSHSNVSENLLPTPLRNSGSHNGRQTVQTGRSDHAAAPHQHAPSAGRMPDLPQRATQTSSPAQYQQSTRFTSQQSGSRGHSQQASEPFRPQTVDPSQFHDSYHEMQRRKAAEAQEQQQREEAARKQAAEDARYAAETKRLADEAHEKANADRLKAEEEQKQNESTRRQAEMAALFLKLREFHEKDPEMLSQMWAKEREQHITAQTASPAAPPAQGSQSAIQIPSLEDASFMTSTQVTPSTAPKKKEATPKSGTPKERGQPSAPKARKPKAKKEVTAAEKPSGPENAALAAPAQACNNQAGNPQPMRTSAAMDVASTAPTAPTAPSQKIAAPTWPEDKKTALSAVASKLIQATPENKGRAMLPSDISALLDKNPTYIELCDSIEKMGFKMNRAVFAKGLLATVPDEKNKRVEQPPGIAQMTSQMQPLLQGKSPTPQSAELPLTPATAKATSAQTPVPSSNGDDTASLKEGKAKQPGSHTKGKASAKFNPQTKEDLARKRTFSDLVDLTQFSDEEPPLEKKTRLDEPAPPISVNPQIRPVPGLLQTSSALNPIKKPQMASLPSDHQLKHQPAAAHLDKRNARRRSKYNPRTIARDVLLSAGRHPEMRPLNAHLELLKLGPIALREDVDLGTLRWDLVDPGGVLPGSGVIEEYDEQDFDDDADIEGGASDSEVEVLNAPEPRPIGLPSGGTTVLLAGPATAARPTAQDLPSVKKRGRPRKSELAGGQGHTPHRIAPHPTTTPGPALGRVATPGSAPGSTSSYAELRANNERAGLGPRRGRPVGWRKWMQKTPDGSSSKSQNGGVKTGKKPPPSPPEPAFPEFACEWEGCERKLHNLDTLRRHIFKLHGKAEGEPRRHPCKWDDCGEIRSVSNGQRTTARKERFAFSHVSSWRTHIEAEHLAKVAWRLGDGPAAGLVQHPESASEHSESYLSDKDGRKVTPRFDMPSRRFTAVNTPARGGRPGTIENAREVLRGAEERRNRLGPGIDVGGAISVDDEMRETMDDDGNSDSPEAEVVDPEDMDFI